MRAAVFDRFGPPEVISVREIPRPVLRDDEVLVRVHAATVSAADRRVRARDVPAGFGLVVRVLFGWSKPRRPVLGTDAAGVIVAVGKKVDRFAVGQPVMTFALERMGAHAEYVRVKQSAAIAHIPEGVSFEQAAALVFGGSTALHFLRRAALAPGERVLVNGASGAVGSAAVSLARCMGAQVTAVCSGANEAKVRALGAQEVVDYAREDFTARGVRYDVIFDAVGNAPYARSRVALARGGRLVSIVAGLPALLMAPWQGRLHGHRVFAESVVPLAEDLARLAQLVAEGHFPVWIGERFALEQIAQAHRVVEGGHKRGSVVVTMGA